MDREIKFRMVYQTTGEIIGYTDVYRLLRYGDDELPDYEKAILQGVSFEQYTGLKDKNGREIYEGDILQIDDHILGDFEVVWHSLSWKIKRSVGFESLSVHKSEDIVLIGNIHENPELLK